MIFSARQSALYAIARPFVRLSVHLSVTRVNQSKTAEVKIMQLSPFFKLSTFLRYKFYPEILTGSP